MRRAPFRRRLSETERGYGRGEMGPVGEGVGEEQRAAVVIRSGPVVRHVVRQSKVV